MVAHTRWIEPTRRGRQRSQQRPGCARCITGQATGAGGRSTSGPADARGLTGCSAHLVQLEVDSGPILVQAAVPIASGDSIESLAARIQRQEHRILPLAVLLAAQRSGLLGSAQA